MLSPFPYRTRRTIKPAQMDVGRDIARDLLVEILADAHWAPTHGLTQPWRFHVFVGAARRRLADALQSLYDRITPADEARAEKRAKLGDGPLQAPVCIAVSAVVETDGRITRLDELCATACAVENLMLSAHQRGIGSFWSTPPVACHEAFTMWLGLDPRHSPMGLVYLGYAKAGLAPASTRVPLDERVTFHSS